MFTFEKNTSSFVLSFALCRRTWFVPIEWNETKYYAVATVFHHLYYHVCSAWCMYRKRKRLFFVTYEQNKINTNASTEVFEIIFALPDERNISLPHKKWRNKWIIWYLQRGDRLQMKQYVCVIVTIFRSIWQSQSFQFFSKWAKSWLLELLWFTD